MPATKYKNVFWYSGKIRFIEPQGINGHIPGERGNVQGRDLLRVVGIVAPRGFSIRGKFVLSIGQAKSSIPALSYFQVGGMKHDKELYAKVSYIPSA